VIKSPGTLAEAYAVASKHVVRVSNVRMAVQDAFVSHTEKQNKFTLKGGE
jgi:hypothetical protein